ncbi:MAG: amino acid-binding protein [Planctomycetota bacterium]
MEQKKQLAIFLANAPGSFYEVCEALAEEDIKIIAMSVSDTIDHAVLRLVVDDPHKAVHLLGEAGLMVVENEVILVDMDYTKSSFAIVSKALSEGKINIEYAYSSALKGGEKFCLVLRTSNVEKTLQILKKIQA